VAEEIYDDGVAAITAEEQITLTAARILSFINEE
jgi:hypothetical protein